MTLETQTRIWVQRHAGEASGSKGELMPRGENEMTLKTQTQIWVQRHAGEGILSIDALVWFEGAFGMVVWF